MNELSILQLDLKKFNQKETDLQRPLTHLQCVICGILQWMLSGGHMLAKERHNDRP